MLSRRSLLASVAASGLAAGLPRLASAQDATAVPGGNIRFVDPMIGTGGHGHVYPGASVPFGMIQLSPDTDNARWDACSGYYYDDKTLLGFSHSHLSGTGASDMLDLLVVPVLGEVRIKPGTLADPQGSYRTRMSHEAETATPGYYSIVLPETGIKAELTASARSGLHRYTFPAGDAHLLIDWAHGFRNYDGSATRLISSSIKLLDAHTLVGSRVVRQWAQGRVIHFALRLSQPADSMTFYKDETEITGATAYDGTSLKVALHFGKDLSGPLLVKAALSAVDVDGALANLDSDGLGFRFDETVAEARAAWDSAIGGITLETDDTQKRQIFYTALYHTHLAPTLFSDSDGRYRGMDKQVHQLPPDRFNYSTYSLWDTYRALHPLMTLIAPQRAMAFAENLIEQGEQSPSGPVIWPLQGVETFCMIGWHSAVVIAEALHKGLFGDRTSTVAKRAWTLYRKLAFDRSTPGLNAYRTLGYIPCDLEGESVSKTLEYAYDDWAMAHMAQAAGAYMDSALLRERSRTYRQVFDKATQFCRPRLTNGQWATPFDPRSMGYNSKRWWDYTESNSWQATFLNQHDIYGHIELFGGDAAFEAKLDALFNASSDLPSDAPPDMTGMIGQYVHGNEPSHHIAYLYAYAGAHHKTQARIHDILRTQYRDDPDGMAGNEDCGQMSAWYILSALGFYPVDPVSGVYVFGSPLFPKADITLGNGRQLTILADGAGDDKPYIDSVSWRGVPQTRSWIGHADLMQGGVLHFVMSDKPNLAFGRAPTDRPPSFQYS
ncbi:GH92 family glycosyl hydrolase [Asticcacaulis sp. 201]|uniref:GH92 family glycosyl hydrolase n=1 Tax=Asticcacaulis sp. 201 TaxID=3028787 RepID=UPI002916BDDD|nr:GH92 family glycosyl hydrolase [Asticcacaulis sp. 201]MDV6332644.1 GH92 family glycosyl hydrolase [Asticcacaulis sp. 201]